MPATICQEKNTQGSDFGTEGQKLSDTHVSTSYPGAYAGVSRPPLYTGGEGDTLLANSQGMAMSPPPIVRRESDRSEGNELYGASDIGLATSSHNDTYSSQYNQPQHGNHRPYQASAGQESGTVAVPYPDPLGEQSGQSSRHNRVSMPFMPSPRSPDPRRGAEDRGNFL